MRKSIFLGSMLIWLIFALTPAAALAASPQNRLTDTGLTQINAESEESNAAEDQTPQPEPSPGRRGRLLPVRY